MKRALFAGLVLASIGASLACGSLTSAAQTLDWKTFNSSDLSFSIRFPGTPKSDPPSSEKKSDGSVSSTTWLFELSLPGVYCSTGVTDYTASFDADSELTADQTNFLKAIDGKLVTSRRAEYISGSKKLPELIFTFEFPKLNFTGRAIVIVQGKRTYMALFAFQKGTEYSTAMDTFLDSLELTGNPGA